MAHVSLPSGRFEHPIPASAGVGLKPEPYRDVLEGRIVDGGNTVLWPPGNDLPQVD